jgi:diguanylate cyclase (GGDEF)-like protein/PAS domain S-box-containing protein
VEHAAIEKAALGPAEVLAAGTLAGGLELLESRDVHLVLLDLNLPDSRGLGTLERMRAATRCPIIVVTIDNRPGLDAEALERGAFEILHKDKLSGDAIARLLKLAEGERRMRRSLEDAELRYRQLVDVTPDAIIVHADWRIVLVNRAALRLLRAERPEQLLGREVLERIAVPFREFVRGRIRRLYEERQPVPLAEIEYLRMDGTVCTAEVAAAPLLHAGRPAAQAVARDVTERRNAERALRESEDRFRSLTELSSDWYWEQDEAFRFVRFSESIGKHGSPPQSHYGKTRWELPAAGVSEAQWAAHRALLEAHQPFRDFEYQRVSERGEAIWVSVSGEPIFDERGRFRGYRGIGREITERKRAEARLEQLARIDPVTGLANRTLLEERLLEAIAQARRRGKGAGVLLIDLDRFKLVNDSLGHHAGDLLLAQVGQRLKACMRQDDTVGRIGGDEFVAVLADLAHAQDAALAARKIVAGFSRPFALAGQEAYVTASIGAAAFPNDGDDAAALLRRADTAMYRAKEASGNAFHFYSADMDEHAASKLRLHTDLRRAFERNEFRLHYQPKVQLASGSIVGMEALLRWQHPARGMVSPAEFIPALEETGLIVEVGDWVIAQARTQLRDWMSGGLQPLPIAVNLSARQFHRRDLDGVIRRLLSEREVPPALLELEITESCLMENPQDAARQLRALRDAGLRISVDDFGTGYSSLAYLTRLPLSTLKIDRSFVNAAISDAGAATIVKMVIDMAQSLRFSVVAEGIETAEHVAFLRRQGCEQGQGYHFGKPVPAAAIAVHLSRVQV